MGKSASAAAASIARLQRQLMLQKQGPLIDKLHTLNLRAVTSCRVRRLGHVIVELHPEVFKEVQFEEHVTNEMKKLDSVGPGNGYYDKVTSTLTKVLLGSTVLEQVLAAYGAYDRASEVGAEKAAEILAHKISNKFKLDEKLKAKISSDLVKLRTVISQMREIAEASNFIAESKTSTMAVNEKSAMMDLAQKTLSAIRGAEKWGKK